MRDYTKLNVENILSLIKLKKGRFKVSEVIIKPLNYIVVEVIPQGKRIVTFRDSDGEYWGLKILYGYILDKLDYEKIEYEV
jgi:hypothetical protein